MNERIWNEMIECLGIINMKLITIEAQIEAMKSSANEGCKREECIKANKCLKFYSCRKRSANEECAKVCNRCGMGSVNGICVGYCDGVKNE